MITPEVLLVLVSQILLTVFIQHQVNCIDLNSITEIPVLKYEKIGGSEGVTLQNFENQMKVLKTQGFQTISIQDYITWLSGRGDTQPLTLPEKPVLITFDYAYASTLLVEDILNQTGFAPVLYISCEFVENSTFYGAMSWSVINRLYSKGWGVQILSGLRGMKPFNGKCSSFYSCFGYGERVSKMEVQTMN